MDFPATATGFAAKQPILATLDVLPSVDMRDPDYAGSQVPFIEQAMRVTMADSLRPVLRDLLQEIDRNRNNLPSVTEL